MGGLFDGLGQLLGTADGPADEAVVENEASSLEMAMQTAIEKHAAERAAASGQSSTIRPRVTVVRGKAPSGVFGRRATSV